MHHPPLILNLNLHLPTTFIPSNPHGFPFPTFPMINLTRLRLARFNLNYFHTPKTILHHHPNSLLQIKPVSLSMADPENTHSQSPPATEKKPEKEPPTPPEKPEPGDCCGSGCVRCVWDVYYEELEAYNLALQQFNSQSKSKS